MKPLTLSFVFFGLLLTVHESLQKSSPSSPTYRAAVVEFKPVIYKNDSAKTLNTNAAIVGSYIRKAARRKADIIVFPELVPTTVAYPLRQSLLPWATEVPEPYQHYSPCDSNYLTVSEALMNVSCEAKKRKIYVAISVIERENYLGRDCPHDGSSFYVTSVVFDRNGIVISRYRTAYLSDERRTFDVQNPNPPEYANFTTDFGVTFGHITGYELLFGNRWKDIGEIVNSTDFILQTIWPVKLPFLSPVQMQAAWSYANDINLLAAGYNSRKDGFTGSGIYEGRNGVLIAVTALIDHEELLIANVSKKFGTVAPLPDTKNDGEASAMLPINDDSLGYQVRDGTLKKNGTAYVPYVTNDVLKTGVTKLMTVNGSSFEKLSHDGIDCTFEVNVTNLVPPATYRLIAFNGRYPMGTTDKLGVRVCSIVSCSNVTVNSCDRIDNSSTIFQSVAVTAIYLDNNCTAMLPSTLGSNLSPLKNWFFDRYKRGEHVHSLIYLPKPTRYLVTFGIWGRNYEADLLSKASKISNDFLGLTILLVVVEKLLA